jgi:hypothetical protein
MLANTEGLVNGGPAGLFWSYIWTFIGFTFVEMSLAEMASMQVLALPVTSYCLIVRHAGHQHPAVNTIGSQNSRRPLSSVSFPTS